MAKLTWSHDETPVRSLSSQHAILEQFPKPAEDFYLVLRLVLAMATRALNVSHLKFHQIRPRLPVSSSPLRWHAVESRALLSRLTSTSHMSDLCNLISDWLQLYYLLPHPMTMPVAATQPPPALIASSLSRTLSLNRNKKIVFPGHISSPSPAQCAVTPSVPKPAASHTPSMIPATNAAQFN